MRPYKYQVPSKPFDDFFLVFKNQLLKHNLYTINCIHLKCTTDNYKIHVLEWNHHYNQDMEFFSLQQFSCVSLQSGLLATPGQLLICLLSLQIGLHFPELYINGITICSFLCLASITLSIKCF